MLPELAHWALAAMALVIGVGIGNCIQHKGEISSLHMQALNLTKATEAMASDTPGLGLGAPLECSHRHLNFLMQVPF